MREIFRYQEDLDPQPVHDKIIAFNTDTIITTNYDHLIEAAAEKNREFIQVISADVDLPYRKAGKELIKIHGDFEHDNFVLKEADYLHYQRNFRLIENYVKSLLGVKTVLFIGYSFNDPDVKQILTWVSEILDQDIQRAYLIEAGERYDKLEDDYFRNLGINLIYSRELLHDSENISANLLETLSFLLEDEHEEQTLLGIVYEYLKPFEQLEYTYFRYIEKVFHDKRVRNHLTLLEDGYIRVVHDDAEGERFVQDIISVVNGEKKEIEQREKIESLCRIFSKSHVNGIHIKKDRVVFPRNEDTELEEAIYYFDYAKLHELKERNNKLQSDKDSKLYLQQATICAFLYDYAIAYACLNNAIDILYHRKEYAQYYISLFSKQNIGTIIQWDPFAEIDKEIAEKVKNELTALNLDKTLSTIPDLGNDNNTFLKELQGFRFASELFYNAYKASNKAKREASQTYMVYGGIPGYEELRIRVFDYYLYCLKNHILADRFRENNDIFDIYVRSLLESLAAPDKGKDNSPWPSSGNVHAEKLTNKDIHIVLRYGDTDVLISLIRKFEVNKFVVSDDAEQYLTRLVLTVPEVLKSNLRYDKGVFERLLIILAHIELNEDFVLPIMESINGIEDPHLFHQMRDALEIFFQALCSQSIYEYGKVREKANELISKLLIFGMVDSDYYHLLRNEIVLLINFCYRSGTPYGNDEIIGKLIKNQEDRLIIDLYPALSKKTQSFIKNYYSEQLNSERLKDAYVYAKMVMDELRSPDKQIEAKCLSHFEEINKKRAKGIYEAYFGNPLNKFANLYRANLIIDKSRFIAVVSESDDESAKWLVDVENYDYDKFNVEWLTYCYDDFLEELSSNETIARKILEKFYIAYFDGKLEKPAIDTVLKFFLNKTIQTN